MSDCKEFLEMIDAYVDGELDQTQTIQFEAHIASCEDCGSLVEMTRALRESSTLLLIDPPGHFASDLMEKVKSGAEIKPKKTRSLRFTLIAACAALAIIAYSTSPLLTSTLTGSAKNNSGGASPQDVNMMIDAATGQSPQLFAAPAAAPPSAGGGGEPAEDPVAESGPTLEEQLSLSQSSFSMGGAEGAEFKSNSETTGLMSIAQSDQDAPMIYSAEFARAYSLIMAATMPEERIKGLSEEFTPVQVDNITYYVSMPNENIQLFISQIEDQEIVLTMFTQGMYVIPGKPETLAMLMVG